MQNIYGAIIGDIVGSYHEVLEIQIEDRGYSERIKILDDNTPLFTKLSSFTDDSILTCAIANAINTNTSYEDNLKIFGNKEKNLGLDIYGRSKFGPGFIKWLAGGKSDSWGNGCAMRISPIGYAFDTLDEVEAEAIKSTICSHNNPESIDCAKAVAGAIYIARTTHDKNKIKFYCENILGKIDFNLKDLQHNYKFTSRAMKSVPQAIFCFLQSESFESTLRNTLSIGGDSDTLASISCAIAGAYYGVPKELIAKAKEYMSDEYIRILDDFSKNFENNQEHSL